MQIGSISGKTSSQKRDIQSSSGKHGSVRSFVAGLLKHKKESTESVDNNAIRKQMKQLDPNEVKKISEFAQKIQQDASGKSSRTKESVKDTKNLSNEHMAYLKRLPMDVIE